MVEQRELRVTQMTWEAEGVVSIRLARIESNDPLPAWTPGAHIDVYVPDGTTRQYSLCGDPRDLSSWQIAVLREPESRGGSTFLHDQLRVGDRLLVTRPEEPLRPGGGACHALIAGGIGITPIMAMAEELARPGRPYSPDLRRPNRGVHGVPGAAGVAGRPGHATSPRTPTAGPTSAADRRRLAGGWAGLRLRSAAAAAGGRGRGRGGVRAGPGRRPLRALLPCRGRACGARSRRWTARPTSWCSPSPVTPCGSSRTRTSSTSCSRSGIEVENDCRDGICGSCITPVLAGNVDHRDLVLTKREQAAMDQMLICCSRPTCERLELRL